MERWEDLAYRSCYQKIFEGKWEEYDPWNADHRSNAKTDLYSTGSKWTKSSATLTQTSGSADLSRILLSLPFHARVDGPLSHVHRRRHPTPRART